MSKQNKKQDRIIHPGQGSIRIIAGEWRGRKLPVVDVDGLRPTSDRIRETLFNWLMPYVSGSRCLDLFAGTGALGFEALSRGAASVDFVERNREVCGALGKNIKLLSANAHTHSITANAFLAGASGKKFDLVFIDPPFADDMAESTLDALQASACLADDALVYVETGRKQDYQAPLEWTLLREKTSKQVSSCLFSVN